MAAAKPALGSGKRAFLKVIAIISAVLSLIPFSPVIEFVAPAVNAKYPKRKIGNVDELIPNSYKIFFYPEDNDPYLTNMLIRLPDGHLRAFNRVCVHLQCLVRYYPESNYKQWKGQPTIECPCHGSIYRPSDASPIGGPAAQIGRGLVLLKLEVQEKTGDIYVNGLIGQIGFGRYVNDKTDPLEPVKI